MRSNAHHLTSAEATVAEKAAALQRIISQAQWLTQHGRLVGQLQLHLRKPPEGEIAELADADEAAAQMAMHALQQLRCLHISARRPAALLTRLCADNLTSLHLQDSDDFFSAESSLLAAALSRLTGLRQLSIVGKWYRAHDSLPAVLAGLSQLSVLQLQPQLPAAALHNLPSELKELQLAAPECEAEQLVAYIRALQQLQSLTLVYEHMASDGRLFMSHAAIWASISALRQLDLEMYDQQASRSGRLTQALASGIAATTQLTRLYGWFQEGCNADVDLVAMLSPLQQLQSLTLHFQQDPVMLDTFGTLFSSRLLQLRSLDLCVGVMERLALAQIALQATQVTQLVLSLDSGFDSRC
jgi:hypothetical protein